MRKRFWALILSCGLCIGWVLSRPHTNAPRPPREGAESFSRTSSLPVKIPARTQAAPVEPPTKIDLPNPEETVEEVRENPHGTPPSLISFASRLAKGMELAVQNESAAGAFYGELEDCARSTPERGLRSFRALCLMNAKVLGTQFPALKERYERLIMEVDPSISKMVELPTS